MSDEQSEIEAAAERMARISDWSNPAEVYGGEDYSHDYSADCATLCQWAVARLAADRAEREERERPIRGDVAWLKTFPDGIWCEAMGTWHVEDESGVGRLVEYIYGPQWWYCNGERIWQDSEPTRGQLLDLLAALGVMRKCGA